MWTSWRRRAPSRRGPVGWQPGVVRRTGRRASPVIGPARSRAARVRRRGAALERPRSRRVRSSTQCHIDDPTTASTLASRSGSASAVAVNTSARVDVGREYRAHPRVGLYRDDVAYAGDELAGERARSGADVDGAVARVATTASRRPPPAVPVGNGRSPRRSRRTTTHAQTGNRWPSRPTVAARRRSRHPGGVVVDGAVAGTPEVDLLIGIDLRRRVRVGRDQDADHAGIVDAARSRTVPDAIGAPSQLIDERSPKR